MASSNGLCLDSIVQLEERKCDIPKRNDSKSPFSTQCSSVLYSIIASSSDNPPFSSFSLEIPRVALETLFFLVVVIWKWKPVGKMCFHYQFTMKEVQKNPIGKQGRKEDDAEPVESKDAFNAFFKLPSLLDSFEKWQ